MSELDSQYIKHGLWTNWERGAILEQTITTDTRTGTIVISLLAVLATLGLSHLWHLLTFAIHQCRAHGRPSDGLYFQQQAIFRSLTPPSSICADNIKLWWAWRRRTNALRRCLPYVIVPLVFVLSSIAASIFTAFAVDTSNIEVLVSSPYCGEVNLSKIVLVTGSGVDTTSYEDSVVRLAAAYADQCYQEDNPKASSCQTTFAASRLPFVQNRTKCPFEDSMCVGGDLPAVSFDTGLIDLNTYLGTNFAKRDAVKFRKKTTCAVLEREGHYKVLNYTDPGSNSSSGSVDSYNGAGTTLLPDEQLVLLFYGEHTYFVEDEDYPNATFSQVLSPRRRSISSKVHRSELNTGGKENVLLIPSLAQKDADVALVAIYPNNQIYEVPVDDPLFAAHRPITVTGDKFYESDYPFGVLACTEQYQYCIARSSGHADTCTSFSGAPLRSSINTTTFPDASATQLATLQFLVSTNRYMTIDYGMFYGLNASRAVQPVHSLPSDQWIIELAGWERFVLAVLQRYFADYAVGAQVRHYTAEAYVEKATTEGQNGLCGAQKMKKAGGLANINLFALVFIVTFTTVVVTMDLLTLRILIFLSRFRKALAPRIDRWIQDGLLQLQRRAFEAQGDGEWEQLNEEVPLTSSDEKLGELLPGSILRKETGRDYVDERKEEKEIEWVEDMKTEGTEKEKMRTEEVAELGFRVEGDNAPEQDRERELNGFGRADSAV